MSLLLPVGRAFDSVVHITLEDRLLVVDDFWYINGLIMAALEIFLGGHLES